MKASRLVPSGGTRCAIALLTLLSVQPMLLSEAWLGGRLQDKPRLSSWKRLSSGDIEAIGDVPDGVLRRAFDEISSFRSAFVGLYPAWRVSSPVPTRILVFPDLDAFRRFSPRDDRGRPMQYVGGYFEAGPDVNILAIGANQSSVVFHEFAHYLLNRNFHSLPLWLHEGLAEFYSTFESNWQNGKGLIGRAPIGRLRTLRGRSTLQLRQSVFASPAEMEKFWRDATRIDLFYAASWALVHYLMLGREQTGTPPLAAFIRAVESGTPHEKAFVEAFGDVDRLENAVRLYVQRFQLPAIDFAMPKTDALSIPVARLPEADARSVQGELLLFAGAFEEADREFEAALKLDRANVAARIGAARAARYRDELPASISALEEISSSHPKNFSAAYYLASTLSEASRHEEAVAGYRRAMLLNPSSPHVWFGQSINALALGLTSQGEAAMDQALRLQPSPGWYRMRAYAALGFGLDATASADVRKFIELGGLESSSSPYSAFVAAIAYWRLGLPDEAEKILEEVRPVTPLKSWAEAVLDFMQGRIPPEKFSARARTQGEKTEAHTYIGFKDAIAGRRDEAIAHFQWVRDQGAKNYVEYGMAKAELRRLERP